MKKFLAILCTLALMLTLVACGDKQPSGGNEEGGNDDRGREDIERICAFPA